MEKVKIPIPDINVQERFVEKSKILNSRIKLLYEKNNLNNTLKALYNKWFIQFKYQKKKLN